MKILLVLFLVFGSCRAATSIDRAASALERTAEDVTSKVVPASVEAAKATERLAVAVETKVVPQVARVAEEGSNVLGVVAEIAGVLALTLTGGKTIWRRAKGLAYVHKERSPRRR